MITRLASNWREFFVVVFFAWLLSTPKPSLTIGEQRWCHALGLELLQLRDCEFGLRLYPGQFAGEKSEREYWFDIRRPSGRVSLDRKFDVQRESTISVVMPGYQQTEEFVQLLRPVYWDRADRIDWQMLGK